MSIRKERLIENEILSDLLIDLNKDLTFMQETSINEKTNIEQAEHLMVNQGNYPRDYEALKDDFVFINTVHDQANMHGYQLNHLNEGIPKLNALISEIENELAVK